MNTHLLLYQTQREDETSVLRTQQQRIHANNFAQQNKWLLPQYWRVHLLKKEHIQNNPHCKNSLLIAIIIHSLHRSHSSTKWLTCSYLPILIFQWVSFRPISKKYTVIHINMYIANCNYNNQNLGPSLRKLSHYVKYIS